MHAGLTAFPISTRNSVVGVAHLIRSTGLRLLFASPDLAMQRIALEATAILEKEGITFSVLAAPQFGELYNEDHSHKQLVPVRSCADPVVLILHSSGGLACQLLVAPLLSRYQLKVLPLNLNLSRCSAAISLNGVAFLVCLPTIVLHKKP
jgi:hypothetical protein